MLRMRCERLDELWPVLKEVANKIDKRATDMLLRYKAGELAERDAAREVMKFGAHT